MYKNNNLWSNQIRNMSSFRFLIVHLKNLEKILFPKMPLFTLCQHIHTKALITSNCDGNALTTTCIRGETFLPGYSCIHKCLN